MSTPLPIKFGLRCNTNSDFVRAEQSVANGEELNERFHSYLTHYFNINHCLRPFIKSSKKELEKFESNFYTYHEHLSQGICRILNLRDTLFTSNDINTAQDKTKLVMKDSMLYYQYSPGVETYSQKVFVAGLPLDVDEENLLSVFGRFGPLSVEWPNKSEARCYVPLKDPLCTGYAFLLFAHEMSIRLLCQACFLEDDKLLLYMSNGDFSTEWKVQVRPWRMADADYVVLPNIRIDPRNAVFVGGVPRPIKAVELAHLMEKIYGPVACVGIDTDADFKYPKGAGRVVFFNRTSYLKAIQDRYVLLSHGVIEKRVELKPYVLEDQHCDECLGEREDYGYSYAPFFCPYPNCLQYYCERCWTEMHAQPDFEKHRPLLKEA